MQLFQVDAFTNEVFGGNPAAVVPLEQWPQDRLLQQIIVRGQAVCFLDGEIRL